MGPSRGQDGGGSRHRCGARNTIFDLPDSAETHFWVGGSPTALQPVRTGTLCLSMCMRVCKRAPGLSTVTESRVPRGQEGKAVPAKSMPVSISTQTFSGRGRGVVHQPGQLPRFTASSNRVTYQHPEGAAFWFTSLSPNRLGAPDASNKFLEAPSKTQRSTVGLMNPIPVPVYSTESRNAITESKKQGKGALQGSERSTCNAPIREGAVLGRSQRTPPCVNSLQLKSIDFYSYLNPIKKNFNFQESVNFAEVPTGHARPSRQTVDNP